MLVGTKISPVDALCHLEGDSCGQEEEKGFLKSQRKCQLDFNDIQHDDGIAVLRFDVMMMIMFSPSSLRLYYLQPLGQQPSRTFHLVEKQ